MSGLTIPGGGTAWKAETHNYPYNNPDNRISIDLHAVFDNALDMRNDLNAIEGSWSQAMHHWNRINDGISWVGKTQQEVNEFQALIDKVRNQIFGTSKEDPDNPGKEILDEPGLYQQVRELALGATQNYDNTDFAVSAMFTQITSNITNDTFAMGTDPNGDFVSITPQPGRPDNGDGVLQPDERAPDLTGPPISETF